MVSNSYARMGKRVFDSLISGAALILLSPVIAVVALLIRFSMGLPLFFRQVRAGSGGKPFFLLKFRTMTDECDSNGILLPDDERLTAAGKWVRASSLDELPELINVLRGEMSLVGPRPLLMEYLPRYSDEQMRRHEVLPGITGWAQINGRNVLSWEQRFKLDLWYVDNYDLRLDLKILVLTLWMTIRREGISYPGQATMSKFLGDERINS
jgi:sugar transferase EpsL